MESSAFETSCCPGCTQGFPYHGSEVGQGTGVPNPSQVFKPFSGDVGGTSSRENQGSGRGPHARQMGKQAQKGSCVPCLLTCLVAEPCEEFSCSNFELPNTRKDPASILSSPANPKTLNAVAPCHSIFPEPVPACEATLSLSGTSCKVLTFL